MEEIKEIGSEGEHKCLYPAKKNKLHSYCLGAPKVGETNKQICLLQGKATS